MPENLSAELNAVRSAMQKFIDDVVQPASSTVDQAEALVKVREASKQAGFYFKMQPESYGGDPASTLELTVLREQLAAANNPLSRAVFGPGPGILHRADGHLRTHYLDPVLSGEKRGSFGFTEADSAKRPSYGVLDNGQIAITGQKSYVTGGQDADFVSALINIEDASGEKLGTAMVVIDLNLEGVEVSEVFSSLDGSGHVSITFNAVLVLAECMVGKPGEGMPRALGNIGNVRLMVSAEATGICLWVLDFVEQHLRAPHRSGTPLGDKEGVRLRFADMRIQTYAARSVLYRAARMVDSGENAVNETIAAKVFCTETAGQVVDWGVQLVGGQALVHGHPLEALYRRVRAFRFVEGASDLLRLNLAKGKLELNKGSV
ncbi:MAG: alkylation response protein AidB-like acyl-CoA dehydrogenase [Sulfitobacter sp.]|jgi:alkylation response protein AidB-like acyl-CoA dehydrogenase